MLAVASALQLSPPATTPFGPGDLKSLGSRGRELRVPGDGDADRSPRALQTLQALPELRPVPTRCPPGTKAGLRPGKVRVTQDPLSLRSWHLALLGVLQPIWGQVLDLRQPDPRGTQGLMSPAPSATNTPGSQLFLFPETRPGAAWWSQLHQALEEGTPP